MLNLCLELVMGWMVANKLKLSPDKREQDTPDLLGAYIVPVYKLHQIIFLVFSSVNSNI